MSKGKTKGKLMSKKKIIACLIILCLALVAGFYFLGCRKTDFDSEVNLGELTGQASTVKKAPTDGTTPTDHGANDNFYYALGTVLDAGGFVGESTGSALTNAGITVEQKVKSYRVVSGNEVYKQSLSHSSFKAVGVEYFVSGKNYVIRDADKMKSLDDVTWAKDARRVSEETFIGLYGCVPNGISAYIMTDNTILSSEYLGEENGIHAYRYELDTTLATAKIRLEMRTMAGTKSLPNFEKAAITVYMTDDWHVVKTETDCTYQVDMLGGVTCNEKLTEVFTHFGEKTEIPNGDFFRGYLDAEVVDGPAEFVPDAMYYLTNGFNDYVTGGNPLDVTLDVSGAIGGQELAVNGTASVNISLDNLADIKARIMIDKLTYGDIELNDLFVSYQGGNIYLKLDDLKAKTSISEITALIDKLSPLIDGNNDGDKKKFDLNSMFSSIDAKKLLDGATLNREDGFATVNLPIELGKIKANIDLEFTDGDKIGFNGIAADVMGFKAIVKPAAEPLDLPEADDTYCGIASLLDIIDEDYNIALNVALGSISADVKVNLLNFNVDATLGDDLKIKFADNTVYVKYQDLKAKVAVSDFPEVMDKFAPLIGSDDKTKTSDGETGGKFDISAITALVDSFKNLDVKALIKDVVSNLTIKETEGLTVISTSALGIGANIALSANDGNYGIDNVSVNYGDIKLTAKPIAATDVDAIDNSTLNEYNNILSVLDIIDENLEINLKATISGYDLYLNVALSSMTVRGKIELMGQTIYVKYADNKIYVSALGLNVYVGIDEIGKLVDLIAPLLGNKFDLSSLNDLELNANDIISSIKAVADENGTLVSLGISGFEITANLGSENGNYVLSDVKLSGEGVNATVAPCDKADYSVIDNATAFYNAMSLLDLIDKDGNVTLALNIGSTTVNLNLNIYTLKCTATAMGAQILINLKTKTLYAAYSGASVKLNLTDINYAIEKLKPIIDKFLPEGSDALGALDVKDIDVGEILSSITVTEADGTLTLALPLFGMNIAAHFDTSAGGLDFVNATVGMGDTQIEAVKDTVIPNELDENAYYVDLKQVLDIYAQPVIDLILSDNISLTLGGSITSGDTVYTIENGSLTLGDIWVKGGMKIAAELTLNAATAAADGSVKNKTHSIRVVYYGKTGYINYNGIEIVFSTEKMNDTVELIKQIYNNIPEIQDLIKGMLPVDALDGLGNIKLDFGKIINSLVLGDDGTLTLDIAANTLLKDLPASLAVTLMKNENGLLRLSVPEIAVFGMGINMNVTAAPLTDASGKFDYDGTNASDFSSINELLKTLAQTSQYRHFSMTAGVDLSGLVKLKDNITLNINIDVIDGNTYVYAHLTRLHNEVLSGELVNPWSDYDGSADLYYDGATKMFYVHDASRTRKLKGFKYVYTTTETHKQYTEQQFVADVATIILDCMHFSNLIDSQIRGAVNGSDDGTSTEIALEDIFKKYSYNNADTFTIDLNLKTLTNNALGDTKINIMHDGTTYDLTKLTLTSSVFGILNISLNASLNTPYNAPAGAYEAVTAAAQSGNYVAV